MISDFDIGIYVDIEGDVVIVKVFDHEEGKWASQCDSH